MYNQMLQVNIPAFKIGDVLLILDTYICHWVKCEILGLSSVTDGNIAWYQVRWRGREEYTERITQPMLLRLNPVRCCSAF